ncbi:MAG: hypothetical protein U1C97_01325, partial [Candidatus Gracilibacteria bacterium]|nr:hypothetical protein [Candidatus Gracilibacteria bacterium]
IEGDGKGLIKKLEALDDVILVMKLDTAIEKGYSVFEIETDSNKDLRRQISQTLVNGGFALVEINREGKTLEDVFTEFTA